MGFEIIERFAEQFDLLKSNSGGSVSTWAWTFGDGTTSSLQNPAHRYKKKGTYTVKLTATGAGGTSTANAKVNATVSTEVRRK